MNIDIDLLNYGNNVRYERDDDIRELSESILRYGVIEPLVVRPAPRGRFDIVCGHRRYRAAQLAGLRELPCRVRSAGPRLQELSVQVAENAARKPMSAFEIVDCYNEMRKLDKTLTQKVFAKICGRSQPWVASQFAAVRQIDGMYCAEEREEAKTYSAYRILSEKKKADRPRRKVQRAQNSKCTMTHESGGSGILIQMKAGMRSLSDAYFQEICDRLGMKRTEEEE